MITYQKLCKIIIPIFHKQIQNKLDYEIYLYALESFLSTVINFFIVFAVALLLSIADSTAIYLLFFLPFRRFEGGIHAKTHFRCITLFLSLMLGAVYTAKCLHRWHFHIYISIFIVLTRNILTIIRLLYSQHPSYSQTTRPLLFITLFTNSIYIILLLINPYYATVASFALFIHTITSFPYNIRK